MFNQQFPNQGTMNNMSWQYWGNGYANDNGCPCGAYCSGTCRRCVPSHRIIDYGDDGSVTYTY